MDQLGSLAQASGDRLVKMGVTLQNVIAATE